MTQGAEHLPSKCEALISNPNTALPQKRKEEKRKKGREGRKWASQMEGIIVVIFGNNIPYIDCGLLDSELSFAFVGAGSR
jgi:hypothetical protein